MLITEKHLDQCINLDYVHISFSIFLFLFFLILSIVSILPCLVINVLIKSMIMDYFSIYFPVSTAYGNQNFDQGSFYYFFSLGVLLIIYLLLLLLLF